ncbi:MAG: DUF3822 family protein [Gelidibacter sp.]
MKSKQLETGQKTIQKKNKLNKNHIKNLSIQISLSGLSFCILNRASHTIEFLKYQSFEKKSNPFETLEYLKKALLGHPELNQPFSSVLIIYQNELSNLVPKELFDEEQSADYLKFNSKILNSDFISHDEIATNESVNVYVPYMNINNFIFDTFGAFEYKHASTILIESLLQKIKNNEAEIYINVNAQHFELVAIKDKKLIIYNYFDYTSREDVIYFLLFTMEQLQLNPEHIQLKLMGHIEKDDELYSIIYKYVRFVEFYSPDYEFDFKAETNSDQGHHNAIILNSF